MSQADDSDFFSLNFSAFGNVFVKRRKKDDNGRSETLFNECETAVAVT